MAKEQEVEEVKLTPLKELKKKKKNKKKKGKKALIFLAIILITALGIYLGRGFIRKQLAPLVQGIPFLNTIFTTSEDPFDSISREQLIQTINTLESQMNGLQTQLQVLEDEKQLLNQRITSLSQYEQSYMQFLEEKDAWDDEIARSNPNLFIEYYERIFPEKAEEVYGQLKNVAVLTKDQKVFATIVGEMDEDAAAKALSEVLTTDPELVKMIFNGMSGERQSLILSVMTTQNAAQVIKLISPDEIQ
jgi:flagellar motility protein MotE (MotC chaperone)